MTEVPEHLLRRSRERKAQASGEAGGDAPAEAASGDAAAVEPAAAAAPAGAGGGPPARPKQPEFTGPPQPPKRNARLPVWAMPVVAALPFWAMLYAGSFGERGGVEEGPVAEGAALFSNCSTCHGSNGEGGGTGPALTDVVATFPEFDAHVAWVTEGSAAVRGQEYAPGKVATGGMPGFGSSLSPEQIIAVVCHERVTIAGQEPVPAQCEADAAAETDAEGGADAGTAENEDAGAG